MYKIKVVVCIAYISILYIMETNTAEFLYKYCVGPTGDLIDTGIAHWQSSMVMDLYLSYENFKRIDWLMFPFIIQSEHIMWL